MAVASLQCYPLLNSPPISVSRSFSARTPVRRRTGEGTRSRLQRCFCSQSADRRSPDDSPPQLERLFSNVNQATMKHEPGSVTGSILLVAGTTVSMAQRTLGTFGVRTACFSYLFIHYALLVAYVARSSEIVTNSLGIPLWESATLFSLAFGGLCYFGSQRVIGAVNGFLVFSIIASFTTLVNILWR